MFCHSAQPSVCCFYWIGNQKKSDVTSGTGRRSRRCVSTSTSAFSISSIIGVKDSQTLIACGTPGIAVKGKDF